MQTLSDGETFWKVIPGENMKPFFSWLLFIWRCCFVHRHKPSPHLNANGGYALVHRGEQTRTNLYRKQYINPYFIKFKSLFIEERNEQSRNIPYFIWTIWEAFCMWNTQRLGIVRIQYKVLKYTVSKWVKPFFFLTSWSCNDCIHELSKNTKCYLLLKMSEW